MTRDRYASQRGISMILVVIVVIVTIILAITSLLMYARLQHLEQVQKQLKEIKVEEQARTQALIRRIQSELQASGLYQQENILELPEARPAEEFRKRADQAWAPMPEKLAYYDSKKDEIAKKEQEIADARKNYKINETLQSLVESAAVRLMYVKNLNDQLKLQLQIAETHAKAVTEMKVPVTTRKIEYKTFLTQQIADVNKKIQEEDQRFAARQQELTAARDTATQGIDAENQRYYQWELDIRNRITELRRQLEELKIKEIVKYDVNTVHGKVLRPDVPNKTAFIDIGSRDRVVPGLKFLAAKRGDQGKFVYKAELEVKKVWPTHAEVSVTRIFDKNVPVIDGDLIVNPLFNTRRAIVVAFAGEEQPVRLRPAWDVKEATRRILEIGTEVRTTVTLDVDYVIFTEALTGVGAKTPAQYPNFLRAATLGVPYEEAAEIFRFLGD